MQRELERNRCALNTHGLAGRSGAALVAVTREIERLREAANLDAAELAPEPLATAARTARQYHLDWIAVALLALSVLAHAALRWRGPRLAGLSWAALSLGLVAAILPVAGGWAKPLGAVVHRGAALLEAASPTAEAVGALREGEVVPILQRSGGYVRVEDSSGARGWARAEDVRSLGARR